MVTLAVVFLASSFKGEGTDSEEGSFTCLLSDLGASCQLQWYHSILQSTYALPCVEGVEGDRCCICSECDREEGLGGMPSCGVSPVLVC